MKLYLTCILSCLFLYQAQAQFAPFVVVAAAEEVMVGDSIVVAHELGEDSLALPNVYVGSEDNRLLIVMLESYWSVGAPTVDSVKFGSTVLTELDTNLSFDVLMGVWYLKAPPSGTDTIRIWTDIVGGTSTLNGAAIYVYNANQATPFGTVYAVDEQSNDTISLAGSSASGELVLDFCHNTDQTLTAGSGQTEKASHSPQGNPGCVAISTKPGAASVTMLWELSSSDDSYLQWVSLKPL